MAEQLAMLTEKINEIRPELSDREKIIFDERILADDPLTLQGIGEKYGITREDGRRRVVLGCSSWCRPMLLLRFKPRKTMMKLFAILLCSSLIVSCINRSTLRRPDDANKKYAFEYCGGQMWGYRKKLLDKGSIYLGVYLENHVNVASNETSVANFVISGKNELDFSFDEVKFEIEINGQKRTRSESLWIAKDGKSIGDKYSGNEYDWTFKEGTTWTVRKKRFGLGMMALGEPFEVTLPVYANKEINSNSFKVEFDKENVRELFVFDKFILTELTAKKMGTATISITTPAFTLNNQRFPSERYIFNLDRDKIASEIKEGTSPCASMEQVFRFGRKDGLNPLNWLGPYLID